MKPHQNGFKYKLRDKWILTFNNEIFLRMRLSIHFLPAKDILFFLSFGIFLTFGILSTSFYYKYFMDTPYSVIKYFCIALLLLREFSIYKYNLRSIIIGLIFVALIIITRSQSSLATVGYILIYLFCARNVRFNDIAFLSAWLSFLVVLFVIASAYVGVIDNYVFYSLSRVDRACLGFRYPLFGPAFLFNITGLILYLNQNKISWLALIFLGLINYWMFALTNSRLSFGLSLMMIMVFAYMKIKVNYFEKHRLLCYLMISSFIICFAASLYLTATYNGNIMWEKHLNTILGGRLSLGKTSLLQSGVFWFGQKLELVGNGLDVYGHQNTNPYNYVDSFYVQILQRYGIVFSSVWILFLTTILYRYYKIKDYAMMLCLTFIALHCTIDDLSLALYYNTFWFSGALVMVGAYKRFESLQPLSIKKSDKKRELLIG